MLLHNLDEVWVHLYFPLSSSIHHMSLKSAHHSFAIKYVFFTVWLLIRKSPAVRVSWPNPPPRHTEVRGQEASIPLRDLWSSLARSGPAPQSHSWWGPRERRGTGSGHCMSSLDAHSRQKSVSDEGLEGSRGVESGAGYTWGFSYFVGSACNIPTSPRSQSPQSDALPVSYGVCWGNTYTNGKLPYVRMFSVLPIAFSCWVYFINRLEQL